MPPCTISGLTEHWTGLHYELWVGNANWLESQSLTHFGSTAVVQFRNGTTLDVVKIDGPASYKDVMKQLAEDVQRGQRGQNPEM